MATVSKTLTELIDKVKFDLVSPGEQGRPVTLAASMDDSTTTLDLVAADDTGTVRSDLIEVDDELMLITAKDGTPEYTVVRGFYGSTAAAHTTSSTAFVNPTFPRVRIAEAIKRSFARMEALGVPLIKSVTDSRETDLSYIETADDIREVLQVLYWGTDGRIRELDGWEFYQNLPTGQFANGTALNVPKITANADELEIVYRAPYRWSTHPSAPVGASTIDIPEGAEDLPALYAAAWLLSSREVSRSEIDRSEEWGRTEMLERGQSAAMVRAKWQEFYRALDEARRLNPIPQPIHYKRRPGLS